MDNITPEENLPVQHESDFTEQVLNEHGLGNIPSSGTLIHSGDSTILIPENDPLVPPPLDDAEEVQEIEEEEQTVVPTHVAHIAHAVAQDVDLSEVANTMENGTYSVVVHTENGDVELPPEVASVEPPTNDGTIPPTFNPEEEDPDPDEDDDDYGDDEDDTPDEETLRNTPNEALPESSAVPVPSMSSTVRVEPTTGMPTNAEIDSIVEEVMGGGTTPPVDLEEEAIREAIGAEYMPAKLSTEEILPLLKSNFSDIITNDSTLRFSGATWYGDIQKQTVIIAGQGGIGSWATMIMSRMHPMQMFIYDNDTVEAVNLAGQLYGKDAVGTKKVNAMANIVRNFSDYNSIFAIDTLWTEDTNPADIMICGFDNMAARKLYFNSWLNHVRTHKHPENCLFIDGRLAFEDMQVFCIVGNDTYNIKRYAKEFLFDDNEAEHTICSMKQTTYCASMIGSLIVNLFTNFIANRQCPMMYDLPFKTYYNANNMYFKTEN